MLDGPVEPIKVAVNVLFEGVTEKQGCYERVAEFQQALERWVLETGQPVEVAYSEIAFGDLEGEEG